MTAPTAEPLYITPDLTEIGDYTENTLGSVGPLPDHMIGIQEFR